MFLSRDNYWFVKQFKNQRTYILGIDLESHDLFMADVILKVDKNDVKAHLAKSYIKTSKNEILNESYSPEIINSLLDYVKNENEKIQNYRKDIYKKHLQRAKEQNNDFENWLEKTYSSEKLFALLNVEDDVVEYLCKHDEKINFSVEDFRAAKVELNKCLHTGTKNIVCQRSA